MSIEAWNIVLAYSIGSRNYKDIWSIRSINKTLYNLANSVIPLEYLITSCEKCRHCGLETKLLQPNDKFYRMCKTCLKCHYRLYDMVLHRDVVELYALKKEHVRNWINLGLLKGKGSYFCGITAKRLALQHYESDEALKAALKRRNRFKIGAQKANKTKLERKMKKMEDKKAAREKSRVEKKLEQELSVVELKTTTQISKPKIYAQFQVCSSAVKRAQFLFEAAAKRNIKISTCKIVTCFLLGKSEMTLYEVLDAMEKVK
eukprot:NODE_330_length_9451_cov_0.342173.p7 type:complete len:260 gc:universal NODE_330_length_9451_cov_0.342173:7526-8305(+)